jgi:hypothetical protein
VGSPNLPNCLLVTAPRWRAARPGGRRSDIPHLSDLIPGAPRRPPLHPMSQRAIIRSAA